MVEFNSSKEFNHLAINSLHQNDVRRQLDFELYGNEDYDALENKFIANYQYKNIQSKNGLSVKDASPIEPIDFTSIFDAL